MLATMSAGATSRSALRWHEYPRDVLQEIAALLTDLTPGTWGEVHLCPGPYGCPMENPQSECAYCRVISVYRANQFQQPPERFHTARGKRPG